MDKVYGICYGHQDYPCTAIHAGPLSDHAGERRLIASWCSSLTVPDEMFLPGFQSFYYFFRDIFNLYFLQFITKKIKLLLEFPVLWLIVFSEYRVCYPVKKVQ